MASSWSESEERPLVEKKKLTRLGSFSSKEVFLAWAKDSLLKSSTVETLTEIHQVDSLPAVLALRGKDIASLGLPLGQARLFEEAVAKLHTEYKYREPPSPATPVVIDFPRYKTLLTQDDMDTNCKSREAGSHFTYDNGNDISGLFETTSGETFCDGNSGTQNQLLRERETDDETQTGCACERWLFIVIFMPVLLVFSLLGFIAWIILWPVNRFCQVGKPFLKVFSATEMLMKSPLEACRWATGRRGRDVELSNEEIKPNYGGTDSVEMKEVERTN